MSKKVNKYGLSRDIPFNVKREVRQRCGYGCVLCGSLFCEYEHFNPPFSEARKHNAKGITLLCARHHDDATRKRLSYKRIKIADSKPFCKQGGKPHYLFEDMEYPLEIALGGIVFISPDGILLKADQKDLLSIKQPNKDEPPLVNAYFKSVKGETLEIVENEIIASVGNWDVETKGAEVIVRNSLRNIFLHLKFTPPRRLQIIEIKNYLDGHVIDTKFGGKLFLKSSSGRTIDFDQGFIATGGKVTLDSHKGIVIDGGALILGAEKSIPFYMNLDHLFGEVRKLQQFGVFKNGNG